jgi:phosphate/sulfate permease
MGVVGRIVIAWVLTLPMAALISWVAMRLMHLAGMV